MSPTGRRAGCPVCRTSLAAIGCEPVEEKRCPRCGADLWALALPSGGPTLFVRRPGQSAAEFIDALVGAVLGTAGTEIVSSLQGADPLDMLELMAEVQLAWKRSQGVRSDPMDDRQLAIGLDSRMGT
jgi:hypothetical protein